MLHAQQDAEEDVDADVDYTHHQDEANEEEQGLPFHTTKLVFFNRIRYLKMWLHVSKLEMMYLVCMYVKVIIICALINDRTSYDFKNCN